jgi:hypothetical protein
VVGFRVRGPGAAEASGSASSSKFEDRDVNGLSLRGSAVLRWEYRPGSSGLFARDRADLLGLQPDNVLMIKFNYRLGT